MIKRTSSILLIILLILTLVSCKKEDEKIVEKNELTYSEYISESNPVITITVKDLGIMEAELFPSVARKTVDNFISYIVEDEFSNSSFHRVIKDFMIQGGIVENSKRPIYGEFSSNGFINPLKHDRGVLSMARTSYPNSATSQFFIMHDNSPHLDGKYASFGGLISGFDVLDKIANTKTNSSDTPLETIVIESITIDLNGYEVQGKVEEVVDLTKLPYFSYLKETNPVITITVKDFGVMKAQLFVEVANNTVNNYINYVVNEDYKESSFHRIIQGFMIQGGGVENTNGPIFGEFNSNGFDNPLKHSRGVLSMARTSENDSATSQFFIMHENAPHLDGQYASFGGLISGFDVLDDIASIQTNYYDMPLETVIIESITIELNGYIVKEVVYIK